MSDMFKRGSTMLNESTQVACNWCGLKVLAYIAIYCSGVGTFYHRKCFVDRQGVIRKERANAKML